MFHACNDGSVVILPAVFPVLYNRQYLITRYSDIGTMIMLGLGVAIVSQALIGHFSKPRQTRYYLAADALLVGVSLLLMTTSTSYLTLVLFYAGIRLGTSIYHPVGVSWVSHSFQGNELDRAMGIQSAFGNIGVMLAFTSTGFLLDSFGWQMPLFIWGGLNLTVLAAGLLVSRKTVSAQEVLEQKESERQPVSWPKAFRHMRAFIPMMLLGGLAWGIMLNYSPSLLNHRLGMSMSKTGMILGGWMCAGTFAALMYGRLTAVLSRRRTLIGAYALMASAAFVLGTAKNVPLIVIAFVSFGLALFTTFPSILSFVSLMLAPRDRTAGFALSANVNIIGNSIFAYISGHISDSFGIQAPFLLLGSITAMVLIYMSVLLRTGRIRTE